MAISRPHTWKELPELDGSIVPKLLEWYAENGRTFPWRNRPSAYHVLCAEVMLQRTRAESVRPVYEEFCRRFRNPSALLSAEDGTATEIFEQLGLTWRAEHFLKMHRLLVADHGGEVPDNRADLLQLPGVGHYVASAVLVFAFDHSEIVIDSNVLRVLGRYHGIRFSKSARRSRRVRDWASSIAPQGGRDCRRLNWALLDHGSLICRPRSPLCSECPLMNGCWFASRKSTE